MSGMLYLVRLCFPTRIYVKVLKTIREAGVTVKACSHIAGGGLYENVPHYVERSTHAVIRKDSYEVPVIFDMLAKEGDIEEHMMYNTFNMGIGMVIAVDEQDVEAALSAVKAAGETRALSSERLGQKKESHYAKSGGTGIRGRHQFTAILDTVKVRTIDNTEVVGVISNNKNAYALI